MYSQRTFRDSLTLHKTANYDSGEGICSKIYQYARDRPVSGASGVR